jgi:catechol 2,3-dioxygenase
MPETSSPGPRLDPATTVGPVSLVIRDRPAVAEWYRNALGLLALAETPRATVLGGEDGTPLVTLLGDPAAAPAARQDPGLYHLAILLPTRADLGRWLDHAGRSGLRLQGAADHLVSEAVYLADPEGNGIEIYRDRPKAEWPTRDGRIHMDNRRLDVEGLLAEAAAEGGAYTVAPAGTVMGHVHLKVRDLAASRAFYEGAVGFDVTEEGYSGALFVSAGGYHHHIGLNTWETGGSAGSSRVAESRKGSAGLDAVSLALPSGGRDKLVERLVHAGAELTTRGDNPSLVDPSGIRIVLLDGAPDAEAALSAHRS